MFCKNHLNVINIENSDVQEEIIICDMYTKCKQKVRFMLIYRPPKYDLELAEKMCILITNSLENFSKCLILGDFNLPKLFDLNENKDPITTLFEECFSFGLYNMNLSATRNDKSLDLVLSTCEHLVFDVISTDPFCNSDHYSVCFKMHISSYQEKLLPKRNFRNVDYEALNGYFLITDWDRIFSTCFTINDVYSAFLNVLHDAIDIFVPFTKCKRIYSKQLRKIVLKKKAFWGKYKKYRNPIDLIKFKEFSSQFKQESLNLCVKEEQNLMKSNDTSKFFKFMNARLKNLKSAPLLVDDNGNRYSENVEKANLFNNYFCSVFTKDDGKSNVFPFKTESKLLNLCFDEVCVQNAMKNMKSSFSIDPDGLCSFFLKRLSFSLCKPLSKIFKLSYQSSRLPKSWKQAIVVPLHKKGDLSKPSNFRRFVVFNCMQVNGNNN